MANKARTIKIKQMRVGIRETVPISTRPMPSAPCDLSDIHAEVDTAELWSIDEDGNCLEHIEDTDYMDIRSYWCNHCETALYSADEVTDHIARGQK